MSFLNNKYILVCFFFLTFLYSISISGQPNAQKTDSLISVISKVNADSDKVTLLVKVSQSIEPRDTTKRLQYAKMAFQLASDIKWERGITFTAIALGRIYHDCGINNFLAIKYYLQARALAHASNDCFSEARTLGYMADAYESSTQYSNALDCYRQALGIKTSPAVIMGELANMGQIYTKLGDYPQALTCFDSSLKVLDESIRNTKKKRAQRYITNGGPFNYYW
jgi:tetratricopeptide (TPR) repeat protein